MNLPEWVPNYDRLVCKFCDARPKTLIPRWNGPHVEAFCPKCKGRLGSAGQFLKKHKYGLDRFLPPAKEDPGQGCLLTEGEGDDPRGG